MVLLILFSTLFQLSLNAQAAERPPQSSEIQSPTPGQQLLSLTLEEATSLGIKNNLDLIASKYDIPIAEAEELTAGLWSNPSLLLDSQLRPFGNSWNQSSTGGPRQEDFILSVPVDISGKRSLARKSAHEDTRSTEFSFQDTIRLKVLEIRLAYIDVLTLQNQVRLLREQQENLNRLVTMIQARIGSQRLLPLLQTRSQLALDQSKLNTQQKEASLAIAITHLISLLGVQEENTRFELKTELRNFKFITSTEQSLFSEEAFQSRPDLQSLNAQRTKSKVDQDLTHAQVFDDFIFGLGLSYQGAVGANPDAQGSTALSGALSWIGSVTLPLPVFNRNQGNIRKSIFSGNQAEAKISALRLSISTELNSTLKQVKLNQEQIEEYESKQLKNARVVRDSAQRLFGTGGSNILEYFDAMNAYQGTLSTYYDVVGEYRRDLAHLNAVVGKDVTSP